MNKPAWNPRSLWESAKRIVTRNLWLKILALILALSTYSALKDRTVDPRRLVGNQTVSTAEIEAEIYSNIKEHIIRATKNTAKKPPLKPEAMAATRQSRNQPQPDPADKNNETASRTAKPVNKNK